MAEKLYGELARIYDLVYWQKDYRGEAEKVNGIISRSKKSDGNDLLEVACGTGRYLEFLKNDFNCTGVDLNDKMLDVARSKLPGMDIRKANMITLNLGKQFDILLCLFSSIGYVKTYENLDKTISNFARHLKPGGLMIIEPFIAPDIYKTGRAMMDGYNNPNDDSIKVSRSWVTQRQGDIAVWDMNFLVAEKDKGVSHFVDRHELGLFEPARVLEIMKSHGLEAEHSSESLMPGRGLYIGLKPK